MRDEVENDSAEIFRFRREEQLKAILAALLLTPFSFAQTQTTGTAVAVGCGPADAHLEVRTDKRQHPTAASDPARAVVFFIQDDTHFLSTPTPTTRMGIDGKWVGATHGNSYFYISVEPGEHPLCASWQSWVGLGTRNKSAAAHFAAEAGGVYYFRVRNSWQKDPPEPPEIELTPLDSDEGQLLASKFSFSTSRPK